MHVVCVGHLNWDVRLYVDRLPTTDDEGQIRRRHESGGGSAANVASGIAELGTTAHFLGAVGDDELGRKAIARLDASGVKTHVCVAEEATTTKYILVDDEGDVALLGTDGANESFGAESIPSSVLESAEALHLTAQRPQTAKALARQASDDAIVSFDPGRRVGDRNYGDVFELVDLLFVNDREARLLDADVPAIAMKRGAEGATWSGPDGVVEVSGIDIGAPIDTTGAGDAFAAGFLSVWIEKRDPTRALAVANACGALAASVDGPAADLSWERIDSLLGR